MVAAWWGRDYVAPYVPSASRHPPPEAATRHLIIEQQRTESMTEQYRARARVWARASLYTSLIPGSHASPRALACFTPLHFCTGRRPICTFALSLSEPPSLWSTKPLILISLPTYHRAHVPPHRGSAASAFTYPTRCIIPKTSWRLYSMRLVQSRLASLVSSRCTPARLASSLRIRPRIDPGCTSSR